MATPVIMPRQGQSVESCIIGKWYKQTGDAVKAGDLLFTYETDKATFDETSKVDGIMLSIFFEEGDDVPCLQNVCVIGQPGESFAEYNPSIENSESSSVIQPDSSAALLEPKMEVTPAPPAPSAGELPDAISPRARILAEKSSADLRFVQKSGPGGRVIERDVLDLIAEGKLATPAAGKGYQADLSGTGLGGRVSVSDINKGGYPGDSILASPAPISVTPSSDAALDTDTSIEKHSNIRKVIARSMQSSLSQMAQLTLDTSFDATDVLALRAKLKKASEAGFQAENGLALLENIPTLNDIILYSVSRVLSRHASCNAHYDDTKITFFKHVHLGVAVDTSRGLMVPTIFSADLMSLSALSAEVKKAVTACQKGTISPDSLRGGTFTVTNLGTMGIESFTPVINPPQTCILGVNTIMTRVRETDGMIKGYPAMGLSLTFDHRALDGAPAARFLMDLVKTLENFSLLLLLK